MEKNQIAWGLDIGHSSIKAVKLSRSGDGAVVLGYAIEPITTGENTDREEAVVKALELLATREEMGNAPVVASLSGRQIFSRTINIPIINPKTVDKMVELEARQQIPGNFEEVEWSYHLSPSPDGTSNDVAIFAAKRELIDELVRKCKRVGINLVAVSVSSLALYNFIRYDQEFPESETTIILDVGAENTDLVLYQGETLWMRTLAVSGNDITKAFMKKFRVSFEEAETLKRQIGESRQADKIFKVIEASINELTSEVQRSLGFYKQQNPSANLENIVISGNTFRLPNLPNFLADRLRYAVISLEDFEKIKIDPGLEREHFLTDLQSLGVAVGLALQGVDLAKANVNLMPSDVRLQRVLRAKRWAAAVILALVAITIAVRYMVERQALTENSNNLRMITGEALENSKQSDASSKLLEDIKTAAGEIKKFNSFGMHKGVATAVMEGVLTALQNVVRTRGPIFPDAKPEEEGGDPKAQPVYLEQVLLPPLTTIEQDPFNPLASPREVMIEIRIPTEGQNPLDVLEAVKLGLSDIPVPPYLKAHPGKRLFAKVEGFSGGLNDVDDPYFYTDENNVDPDGDVRPKHDAKSIKVNRYKLKCVIDAKAGER
jgi:type IV pilus assembly protein PilM